MELVVLHCLTIHLEFSRVAILNRDPFLMVLSTIISPVFHELVLELAGHSSHSNRLPSGFWGHWKGIDDLLEEQFAKHGHFMLVVRMGGLDDQKAFQRHVKDTFPFLAGRGCVHFETFHSVGRD